MLAPARLMLIAPEWTPLAIAIVRYATTQSQRMVERLINQPSVKTMGGGGWFKAVAGRAPGIACLVSKAFA